MHVKHTALLVLIGLALAPAIAFAVSTGETPAARGRGYANLRIEITGHGWAKTHGNEHGRQP